ncbi:MAG: CCA tRNA nucleotidyltransferase [Clostridia bacterium]|nr:CCA tRNA nucleotidyltransferase [Clostridia bacterium]
MQINIPNNVKFVLDTLSSAGFKAYIVGGCVRDNLLNLPAGDYDVCTNAKPEDVMGLFTKTVATGIKHGTVTVIIDRTPVEVTTFRTDGDYSDSRRPDTVEFTNDLKADLSRRDFTVNAMCYNEAEGLIDYFGGRDDLKAKTLRTVGDSDKRFCEDALRILRLFRFASTLDFKPEKHTFDAAIKNARSLKNISAERIEKEIKKLSCGKNPAAVLPLVDTGVLPLLKSNEKISDIPLLPDNEGLKFFTFLYFLSDDLPAVLDFLKCSNAFKKYALSLSGQINAEIKTRADIKRLLRNLENGIFDLLCLKSVIFKENTEYARRAAKEIIESGEPYKISQLKVNGKDIKTKGYKGKEVNDVLEKLLKTVTEEPNLNEYEILMNLI